MRWVTPRPKPRCNVSKATTKSGLLPGSHGRESVSPTHQTTLDQHRVNRRGQTRQPAKDDPDSGAVLGRDSGGSAGRGVVRVEYDSGEEAGSDDECGGEREGGRV
jgi:hypothetical protein